MRRWQHEAFFRYGTLNRVLAPGTTPPPPPAVGQVWVDANVERPCDIGVGYYLDTSGMVNDFICEQMIVEVQFRRDNGEASYRFLCDVGGTIAEPQRQRTVWPPPGAILVAGPGAPWMPVEGS